MSWTDDDARRLAELIEPKQLQPWQHELIERMLRDEQLPLRFATSIPRQPRGAPIMFVDEWQREASLSNHVRSLCDQHRDQLRAAGVDVPDDRPQLRIVRNDEVHG
jgi:hypothetical protein